MPLEVEAERLRSFSRTAPAIVLLELLLYHACLRVAETFPFRGAVRGTEIVPNTRGVEDEFDRGWSDLETRHKTLFDLFGLTRNVARRYLDAKRHSDPEPPVTQEEDHECLFFFGCPTRSLDEEVLETLVDRETLKFQQDHWRPASMGGRTLQTLCAVHNRLKGDSLLLQPDVVFGEAE
jgi:hypothetical protein